MYNTDPTQQAPTDDQEQPVEMGPEEVKFALSALSAVKTRMQEFEKGWWKQAENAEKIYSADKVDKMEDEPYNILYSNTEVLLPSLYSATPKPDVRARFRMDLKPLPELINRFLQVASDPASPGGDCFDNAMSDAVLSSLVPGLGYVRIRYVEDRSFPLTYESGHYKTIIWAKATRWAKVPWVAFAHSMTKQAMIAQFNLKAEDVVKQYVPSSEAEDEKDDCTVFEFWDKKTRKVYFLCEEWREKQLKISDDPLGMENFYPTPGLLNLTMRNGKMLPIPLYNYYRNQAEELNRVTVRLNKVLSAIRVRGAYNGLLGEDLKKLLGGDDLENDLIAAGEAGLLAQTGGFEKHIWMLPIDKMITVAQELYKAREAIKQVIYELTGISDIIRGSSVASETATAQDLKNKWGTVRLRRMQTTVANYARDLFRMSVDCGADHIPPEKWKEITQMNEIPTAQEQAVAKQQLQHMQFAAQQMQAQQQMAQQAAPIPGQSPAQPPPIPQPDPAMVKASQGPNMEQLLDKIKSDMNRTFVVNIQTSSTIDLDTAQDKAEVTEFMNAMGQLMAPLGGLVQMGPSGLEAAKAILSAVCLRYKFGIDIADVIQKIQPPPPPPAEAPKGPPPPTPEEMQAKAAIAQFQIQKAAADTQVLQAQTAYDMQKVQADQQKLSIDIQAANLALEEQRATLSHNNAMREAKLKQAKQPKPIGNPVGA